MPIDSRKGENNHCWMKANCCFSTPLDLPVRPSYWLFRVATTSRYISYINITRCTVWLEKTHLHHCFHRIQRVNELTNYNTAWDLALIGVEWLLSMVGKKKSSPPLDVCMCQLGPAIITNIHSPTWLCLTLGIIAIGSHPPAIFNGSQSNPHKACRINIVAFGHTTHLRELRFPRCHTPTRSGLYNNRHRKLKRGNLPSFLLFPDFLPKPSDKCMAFAHI